MLSSVCHQNDQARVPCSGITQSILDGTQPSHLTLADLMRRDIPVDWTEQRRALGFL